MADFGIGLGAFANGLAQGLKTGKELGGIIDDIKTRGAIQSALDDAQKQRLDSINAQANKNMGLDSNTNTVAGPVDVSAGPQATPLAPQGNGGGGNQPAQPASPPAGPSASPQLPAGATSPTPTANSGSMSPAPSPAQAVAAARSLDNPQSGTTPIQSAAQAASQPTAAPAAAGGISTSATPLMTQDQAQALAEKSAPSVMDFFMKQGVPKIAQTYIAQGDPAKAQAWIDWANQSQNQEHMANWAKAWRSVQLGDVQGAATNILKLYNGYDDGVTASNAQPVKDKDGNITGFNVNLTTDATGEKKATFVDRNTLMNAGLASLAPPQMFQMVWQKQQTQDAAAAKAQQMVAEQKLKTAGEIAVEGAKQPNRIALANTKAENNLDRDAQKAKLEAANQTNTVQANLQAKVTALSNAGYSDDFIKNNLPDMLGLNQYKKATSPDEAKRLAFGDRMKNDPTFAYKSADQQRQIIDQDMSLIYGGLKPSQAAPGGMPAPAAPSAPAPAAPTAPAQPVAAAGIGAPAGPTAPGAPTGRPFLDKQTGKVVYLP